MIGSLYLMIDESYDWDDAHHCSKSEHKNQCTAIFDPIICSVTSCLYRLTLDDRRKLLDTRLACQTLIMIGSRIVAEMLGCKKGQKNIPAVKQRRFRQMIETVKWSYEVEPAKTMSYQAKTPRKKRRTMQKPAKYGLVRGLMNSIQRLDSFAVVWLNQIDRLVDRHYSH